jgi:hypothetical protein
MKLDKNMSKNNFKTSRIIKRVFEAKKNRINLKIKRKKSKINLITKAWIAPNQIILLKAKSICLIRR